MGRLLTFVLIIIIPLLKRVCVFNRAEQGVCKCGLYITASIYIPWPVTVEMAIWQLMGNELFFSLALKRKVFLTSALLLKCIVGHISKHIREEWMSFTPMSMFPQTQHWHIPWTKVLVLFLLMLHHFCPWASLLNSQTVILALLVRITPLTERDGTEPDPREEYKKTGS